MLDFKLKIGLVPNVRNLGDFKTRKGIFEPAKGVENKNKAVKFIRDNFSDEITEGNPRREFFGIKKVPLLYLQSFPSFTNLEI